MVFMLSWTDHSGLQVKMEVKIADGWTLMGSCLLSCLLCNLIVSHCCVFVMKGTARAMVLAREEWAVPNTYRADAIRAGGSDLSC